MPKPKNQKIEEGVERNAEWRKMTPIQQLADLDRRHVSARRQRAKLQAILAAQEKKK